MKEWAKRVQPLGAEASKTKVAQYTLKGELLEVFASQREASEKTGTCRSSITQCVRGKRYSAGGGYLWAYFSESSTTTHEENPASLAQDPKLGDDIV